MKYLKYYENKDIDPFREENWNEEETDYDFLDFDDNIEFFMNNGEPLKYSTDEGEKQIRNEIERWNKIIRAQEYMNIRFGIDMENEIDISKRYKEMYEERLEYYIKLSRLF